MGTDLIRDGLTAVANAVADRNAFAAGLEAARYLGNPQQASKYKRIAGGKSTTTVDTSSYITDAMFELNQGQPLNVSQFRGIESKWDVKEYTNRYVLTVNDKAELESNDYDMVGMVDRAHNGYTSFVAGQVARLIRGMYGDTGYEAIYARYEDNATHELYFDTGHVNGAATTSNHLTDKIDAFDATHYGYLVDSIAAWEALPDALGNTMGMGNDFRSNGVILIAPNLRAVFQRFANTQTIAAGQDNMYYQNLPFVAVPGLADDTVVITRRPTDVVPGFMWHEAYVETVVPPRGNGGNINYEWYYSARIAVTGSVWMTSLLVL